MDAVGAAMFSYLPDKTHHCKIPANNWYQIEGFEYPWDGKNTVWKCLKCGEHYVWQEGGWGWQWFRFNPKSLYNRIFNKHIIETIKDTE